MLNVERYAIIEPPKLRCPSCGNVNMDYTIKLTFEPPQPENGTFCLLCLARWIDKHVPRMVPIEPERKEEDHAL